MKRAHFVIELDSAKYKEQKIDISKELQHLHDSINSKKEELNMCKIQKIEVTKLHKQCKEIIAKGQNDNAIMVKEFNYTNQLRNINDNIVGIESDIVIMNDMFIKMMRSADRHLSKPYQLNS